jgi:hypothetical protein
MATKDPVRTPMTDRTARALESANPFATPVPEPKRLDGQPIVKEREPVAESASEPPLNPENASYEAKSDVPQRSTADLEQEPEPIPEDVAELLRAESEPTILDAIPLAESNEEFQNPIIESRNSDGMPSYRCEFGGRDIFVAWPWYKHSNPVTAATQVAFALDFGRDKIRFDMSIGDAKIEHSRNRLAHKFLETDAKWMLMIDDDIIPSIGRPAWLRYWVQAARNVQDAQLQRHGIHRLVGANKTLVGGAYFGRQENGALMCSDQSLFNRAKQYEDVVVPVDWIGTGFILIHRKVFQDIREKFGDSLKIDVPDYDYDYFRPFDSARGEDVSFCIRAKQAGHQPHIDLGIPIFHVGYKTY